MRDINDHWYGGALLPLLLATVWAGFGRYAMVCICLVWAVCVAIERAARLRQVIKLPDVVNITTHRRQAPLGEGDDA